MKYYKFKFDNYEEAIEEKNIFLAINLIIGLALQKESFPFKEIYIVLITYKEYQEIKNKNKPLNEEWRRRN